MRTKAVGSARADDFHLESLQSGFKVETTHHQLEFKLSLDGFVVAIVLDLHANGDNAAELVSSAQFLNFDWTALDARVKAFDATLETLSVQVPSTGYDEYEQYLREQMRDTEAAGRLNVMQRG